MPNEGLQPKTIGRITEEPNHSMQVNTISFRSRIADQEEATEPLWHPATVPDEARGKAAILSD